MQPNKWLLVLSSLAVSFLAWASQQNWADLTPEYAAYIAMAIAFGNAIVHIFMPSTTSAVIPKPPGASTLLTSHDVVPDAKISKATVQATTLRSIAWLFATFLVLFAISQAMVACTYLDEATAWIDKPSTQQALGVIETGISGLECKVAAASSIAQQVEKTAKADAKAKAITGIIAVASSLLCPQLGGTLTGNTVPASASTPVVTAVE